MKRKKTSQHGAKVSARGKRGVRVRSSAHPRPATKKTAKARKHEKKLLTPLSLSTILLVVFVFSVWSLYPVAKMQYQEERNKARLEAELEALKENNARLRAEVDRLKTPEGVEEVAREELGLVKEGENLYVVMDSQPESVTVPSDPEPHLDENAWLRVLDVVFGFEG